MRVIHELLGEQLGLDSTQVDSFLGHGLHCNRIQRVSGRRSRGPHLQASLGQVLGVTGGHLRAVGVVRAYEQDSRRLTHVSFVPGKGTAICPGTSPWTYSLGMDTLLAEDLLLLLLDDSGRLTRTTDLDTGIGGALLMDLALNGCVEVRKRSATWARAKVAATDVPPPADPLLVESLALVRAKHRIAQDLVPRLGKKRRDVLLDRLRQRGVVTKQEDRVLGLIPRRRWLTLEPAHEDALRRELSDVLVRGGRPEPRTASLVAVLSALDLAHKVIDREGLSRRAVRKRAKQVGEGDWVAKAVRDAVAAAQGAVAAAAS